MTPSARRAARGLACLALAALCGACRRPANLLVVTWDTTRADALAPYGNRRVRTPAAAALAARGVVFERASTVAPLTLPAHTSLFTGTYPPFHGVRDNGAVRVPAAAVTLAELLRARGYRTGAFVGAYVLDARWGLDQGFDTYSGSFEDEGQSVFSLADLSRPADRVADDALRWLAQPAKKPFFAWVHFYDPHSPYQPPARFAQRFPDAPYLGEIEFTDEQTGRLLTFLDRAGLREDTIVVLLGDHGEGFGEHGEEGHGLLLHEETLHVPLIVVAPRAGRAGSRSRALVSLVDVLPTLAELLGLPRPAAAQGRSLVPLLRGEDAPAAPEVYAETLYPRLRFGWSELLSLQDARYRLVVAGKEAELYDLRADPGERHDLAAAQPALVASRLHRLRELGRALERGALKTETIADREASARIAALGYVGTGPPTGVSQQGALPNPKDELGVFRQLAQARGALAAGDAESAERELASLVAAEPLLVDAHVGLGEARMVRGRYEDAAVAFAQALHLRPSDPTLLAALATAELQAGRPAAAERLAATAIALDPREPRFRFLLGRARLERGDLAAAEQAFAATLQLNPRSAYALVELAGTALARQDLDRAAARASAALALMPRIAGAHLALAYVHERRGELATAWSEAGGELALRADPRVLSLLEGLAPRLGRQGELVALLGQAIARHPESAEARLLLARLLLARGERYEEAVRLVEGALQRPLGGRNEALAYYLLADLHNRLGHYARSDEYAARARRVAPQGGGHG